MAASALTQDNANLFSKKSLEGKLAFYRKRSLVISIFCVKRLQLDTCWSAVAIPNLSQAVPVDRELSNTTCPNPLPLFCSSFSSTIHAALLLICTVHRVGQEHLSLRTRPQICPTSKEMGPQALLCLWTLAATASSLELLRFCKHCRAPLTAKALQ